MVSVKSSLVGSSMKRPEKFSGQKKLLRTVALSTAEETIYRETVSLRSEQVSVPVFPVIKNAIFQKLREDLAEEKTPALRWRLVP